MSKSEDTTQDTLAWNSSAAFPGCGGWAAEAEQSIVILAI